jgi:hypothetical protein
LIFVKRSLLELDLFDSVLPSQDPKIIRRNRRTTRVYLILLFTSIFILVLYTSLRKDVVTVINESPSVSKYEELFGQYPLTLRCPCNSISVKYKQLFSHIEAQYHQICSHTFVSSTWLENWQSLLVTTDNTLYVEQFPIFIRSFLNSVAKFCNISKNIINLSLPIFEETNFFTVNVISRVQFEIETEALIEQFKRTTAHPVMEIWKLIQATNHANQLATIFSSNWRFIYKYPTIGFDPSQSWSDLDVLTLPQTYGRDNISCAMYPNYSILVDVPLRTSNESFRQILSGFLIGCLHLDSLLQSSFICLYNSTCLDMLLASVNHPKPVKIDILTESLLSLPNTTIETNLNQLFVSSWIQKSSFDRYFNACAPQSCEHSFIQRHNIFEVISTVIAVFGGLWDGLHFIVFCIALILFKLIDHFKKKRQVSPNHNQSVTSQVIEFSFLGLRCI